MNNFHGWTDNKSYVVVTMGRSKRYGVATLGKKDTFDLVKGTQVALLRLFLTPKTLSAKPKGVHFGVQVSPCGLYYEVWRCLIERDYVIGDGGWGEVVDPIAPNLKVAVTMRATGLPTGQGFIGHPDYAPTFQEIEKTLSFLMTNDQRCIIDAVINEVAKVARDTPDNQLCTIIEPFTSKPCTTPGTTVGQSLPMETMKK